MIKPTLGQRKSDSAAHSINISTQEASDENEGPKSTWPHEWAHVFYSLPSSLTHTHTKLDFYGNSAHAINIANKMSFQYKLWHTHTKILYYYTQNKTKIVKKSTIISFISL